MTSCDVEVGPAYRHELAAWRALRCCAALCLSECVHCANASVRKKAPVLFPIADIVDSLLGSAGITVIAFCDENEMVAVEISSGKLLRRTRLNSIFAPEFASVRYEGKPAFAIGRGKRLTIIDALDWSRVLKTFAFDERCFCVVGLAASKLTDPVRRLKEREHTDTRSVASRDLSLHEDCVVVEFSDSLIVFSLSHGRELRRLTLETVSTLNVVDSIAAMADGNIFIYTSDAEQENSSCEIRNPATGELVASSPGVDVPVKGDIAGLSDGRVIVPMGTRFGLYDPAKATWEYYLAKDAENNDLDMDFLGEIVELRPGLIGCLQETTFTIMEMISRCEIVREQEADQDSIGEFRVIATRPTVLSGASGARLIVFRDSYRPW